MNFIKYHLNEIIIVIITVSALAVLFYVLSSKKRRSKVGFYISFFMFKLGLKKRISGKYVGMVHVKECYEPLVDVVSHPKIIVNNDTVEHPVLLRKEVALKLYKIADKLPDGLYLKLYSAFRSRIRLYEIWKKELDKAEKDNPTKGRSEILSMVNYKVTAPNVNMGGHDTGAAIDIALCDKNGIDLDYGTKYHESSQAKSTVVLNKEQKQNRKFLHRLMKSQDFVQQPSQWWHYSYGDRFWAVYKGKRYGAVYSSAEKEFENTGYVRIIKTNISTVNN